MATIHRKNWSQVLELGIGPNQSFFRSDGLTLNISAYQPESLMVTGVLEHYFYT